MEKKIYIIAGESSGDLIGGMLIDAVRRYIPSLQIIGVGGEALEERGLESLFPMQKISLMGFIEIIPHIFELKRLIKQTVDHVLAEQPDIVLTIDSPGFNFRVVKQLRKANLNVKFIHVVAPSSIWAFRPKGAIKVAQLFDHLLTFLPFEPDLFTKHGLATTFIGHPIFEQNFYRNTEHFRASCNIPREVKILCITPGSRPGEIKRHLDIFCNAAIKLQKMLKEPLVVLIALSKNEDKKLVLPLIPRNLKNHLCVTEEHRIDAYAAADVALAKSGTNTLEISAAGTPMIVGYRLNPITYLILRTKMLIKYVSLVNILAGEEIIPEFIQHKCQANLLANKLYEYLNSDKLAEWQVDQARTTIRMMGYGSNIKASDNGAKIIVNYIDPSLTIESEVS